MANNISYQQQAVNMAKDLSERFSEQNGMILKFNGHARGANLFIETADVQTTKWAAINNSLNTLRSDTYAPIRRTFLASASDVKPTYEICNLVIPADLVSPDNSLLPVDTWLQVSPDVIDDLVDKNQIWVGDDLSIYQKDLIWVESDWFQNGCSDLAARLG